VQSEALQHSVPSTQLDPQHWPSQLLVVWHEPSPMQVAGVQASTALQLSSESHWTQFPKPPASSQMGAVPLQSL
jgi:hypothetical protein